MSREWLTKWLTGNDSFLSYTFKSVVGLAFNMFIMQVVMPTYLTLPLLPPGTVISRNIYLSLIIASLGIIIGGHITFQIYFALPYLLVNKWLEKKAKKDG